MKAKVQFPPYLTADAKVRHVTLETAFLVNPQALRIPKFYTSLVQASLFEDSFCTFILVPSRMKHALTVQGFIQRLLKRDVRVRLGAGVDGAQQVKVGHIPAKG